MSDELNKMLKDATIFGSGFLKDGKHIPINKVRKPVQEQELKPCPFCDGKAQFHYENQSLIEIGCKSCEISPCSFYQTSFPEWKEEAIREWNTRADNKETQE